MSRNVRPSPWVRLLIAVTLGAVPVGARAQTARQQADTIADYVRRASAAHPAPGDKVYLHVWRDAEMTDTVMVDERGEIVLPKVGIVRASSMSIGALRDTVRTRFAEFYRDSPIDLVVLRRVMVNGEVGKPDIYYLDVSVTLSDAIARAGGVGPNGHSKRVVLVRDGARTEVPNWENDRSAALDLRSGDQIVVGRRSWMSQNILGATSAGISLVSLVVFLARR